VSFITGRKPRNRDGGSHRSRRGASESGAAAAGMATPDLLVSRRPALPSRCKRFRESRCFNAAIAQRIPSHFWCSF
jgi:hypothetical protein